jgi:hypothetical protein
VLMPHVVVVHVRAQRQRGGLLAPVEEHCCAGHRLSWLG